MVSSDARLEIERMIEHSDLAGLLHMTALLHGHYCIGSALGVMAAHYAMKSMNVLQNTGMEHLIAIVETNSCFSDGVQMVTGCSFGNNSLVYRDFGKTAFSLVDRSGVGFRVSVHPDVGDLLTNKNPEAQRLYTKTVNLRKATPEEEVEMLEANKRHCFEVLSIPVDQVFKLEEVKADIPSYSRILSSNFCSKCGEKVIETRALISGGVYYCIPCSGKRFNQLDWAGIHCTCGN